MRHLWVIVFCLLASSIAHATIAPSAVASRCTTGPEVCPAPLAIFFSARGTTCSTAECDNDQDGNTIGNEAFHGLYYEWGFGDPAGGATWAISGQSKNVEYGPLAAHVFDTAGTYTISLTIHSDSETSSTTPLTIYVDDPETVFASNTVCISNDTDHTGCPVANYRVNSESDYDSALSTALATGCGGGGCKRILFHAGDTFVNSSSASLITVEGPAHLGSYGTDNSGRAIIDQQACQTCIVADPGDAGDHIRDDWRFVDLEVRSMNPTPGSNQSDGAFATWDSGDVYENTLWYRIQHVRGNSFLVAEHSGADWPNGAEGLFVVDSHVAGEEYAIYIATLRGALLGNTIGDSTGPTNVDHLLRVGAPGRWEDMVISHNETECCSVKDTSIRGEEEWGAGYIDQFMVIRENHWADTDSGAGWFPFTIRPENPTKDDRLQNIIVENNRFDAPLMIECAKTVVVRNNLFTSVNRPVFNGSMLWVRNDNCTSVVAGWFDDVMIYNNSVYSATASENFIRVQDNLADPTRMPDAYWVYNNAYWNSDAGAEVYTCDGDPGPSYCDVAIMADNIDRDDMATSPFASDPPDIAVVSDWYLTGTGSAAAIDTGTDLGSMVYDDFQHTTRPSAAYDIGAMELTGEAPSTTELWSASARDFVIAIFGDLQACTNSYNEATAMPRCVTAMQNIAAHADLIDFVYFTGDIVQNSTYAYCGAVADEINCTDYCALEGQCVEGTCNDPDAVACEYGTPGEYCEWTRALYLISIIEAAGIPWGVTLGNHDALVRYDTTTCTMLGLGLGWYKANQFLSPSHQSANSKETGSFVYELADGYGIATYHVVEDAGSDWLIFMFPYPLEGGEDEQYAYSTWMHGVAASHPEIPIIGTAHRLINGTSWVSNSPYSVIVDELDAEERHVMDVGGHFGGSANVQCDAHEKTSGSGPVVGVLHDFSYGFEAGGGLPAYCSEENGGGGVVGFLTINPRAGTVHYRVYAATEGEFVEITGGDGRNILDWTYSLPICGDSRFTMHPGTCLPRAARRGYLQ